MKLQDIKPCLRGIYPASFYTCSRNGIPNANFLSHIHYVDENHVAISGQFLNKTKANLKENPLATAMLCSPLDVCHVELELIWKRSESSGPVFDIVHERIQAIDSQLGGHGQFKLQSVEIFEVSKVCIPDEFQHFQQNQKEIQSFSLLNLQMAIMEIQKAKNLEELYERILESLEVAFGFKYSVLLVPETDKEHLITITSHGYTTNGVGSEIKIGEGIIGKVAESKRPMAFMNLKREYVFAQASISQAIEFPCLPDAASQMGIPLLARGELMGVLQVDSVDNLFLKESDEEFLMTFGSYVAITIENFHIQHEPETDGTFLPISKTFTDKIHVAYYAKDECIFIDGEYLIRNIPAKVLWRILNAYTSKGQCEFSNRELRLDHFLKLPEFKDNLETRLILLRKRLEKKCPAIKMYSCGRGKFSLQVEGVLKLEEI